VLAVPHHGDAIAEPEDLFELVRDVDQRDAPRPQPVERREQVRRLPPGQGGGRLVQDEDAAIEGQGARDLQELLLGRAERGHFRFRAHRDVQIVQQGSRPLPHLALAQPAEAARQLAAGEDVLGRAEVREEEHLLVDHPDPPVEGGARAVQVEWLPVPGELAGIGTDDAGQDAHQRGLARAVLADEGMRLPLLHREGDVAQRAHRAERLRDALEGQQSHEVVRVRS
jgi:hypothetical protein